MWDNLNALSASVRLWFQVNSIITRNFLFNGDRTRLSCISWRSVIYKKKEAFDLKHFLQTKQVYKFFIDRVSLNCYFRLFLLLMYQVIMTIVIIWAA